MGRQFILGLALASLVPVAVQAQYAPGRGAVPAGYQPHQAQHALYAPHAPQQAARPVPARPAAYDPTPYQQMPAAPNLACQEPQRQDGYVNLNAPLYASPQPNVPHYTGGSFITNPAFAPHEMLYAHDYKALYPPYYHKVRGTYLWTPLGMKNHENWKLEGTMVQVKYRSHYPLIPGFHVPHTSSFGGPWK